jgi:hypothetical protein
MKFNSYFVVLDHPETNVTGNLLLNDEPVSVNFTKVEDSVFTVHFKNQVELKYNQKLGFKNHDLEVKVLFPVLSKYNKRKLKKVCSLLNVIDQLETIDLMVEFLKIEKFLKVDKLLHFLSFQREEILHTLVQMELRQIVKVIDFQSLYITSYKNFQGYVSDLEELFAHAQENNSKNINVSDVEAKLKIPRTSIFFNYLLAKFQSKLSFRILKDKVVFRKVGLTEKEKQIINEIKGQLHRNKLVVFSIEDIVKNTGLPYKVVNNSLWFLINNSELVQLSEKYYILQEDLSKIINRLKKYKRNQGEFIDIKAFRELTTFSRKYIIAVLEYFDTQNITNREGNKRKILLGV